MRSTKIVSQYFSCDVDGYILYYTLTYRVYTAKRRTEVKSTVLNRNDVTKIVYADAYCFYASSVYEL